MKIKPYIYYAAALIFVVYLIYWLQFYVSLGYSKPSEDPAAWGQLGDYVGGILNPLLSFISIVLLIKSLLLQHEANTNLKMEMKNAEKTEKLRSFEVLFFNLISSQKGLFDSFHLVFKDSSGSDLNLSGAKAVIEIENIIEAIREKGGSDSDISFYLTNLDSEDQIFGLSRAFYISVMIITDKLCDSNGFTVEDRSTHLKALINFTDFAQLRLIMISTQFLEYESAKYLRSSAEFLAVIKQLGLSYELY